MEYSTISLENREGVCIAKINRPKALNALNPDVLNDLVKLAHEVNENSEIKLLVLTGEGDKAFVAGADIAAMQSMSPLEANRFCQLGHQAMSMIENCRKPVIAAVNGFCLGGGLELALSCDFIYASEKAKLGLPEVNLGIFPGFGGTQRLPRLIGKNRAKELIFTAAMLSAQQAQEWGIVNKVCSPESLLEEVEKTAHEILKKGPVAIELAKRSVNEGTDLDINSGLALEKAIFPSIFSTEDKNEGITAFLEKRAANFKGQ
ncbi:MAG: enoyl-CoA hydratase/isomerase family protein [Deltaproteobacteria bacterium]|nr:enoyl-CoA hydratase/isomerase family protein [Deltaproteobacteria bacterium]